MGEPKGLVYVEDTGSTATTYTDTEVTAGVAAQLPRAGDQLGAELGEKTKFFKTKVFPLRKAANSPATGAPAISGVAQVGETLTADTSGIVDADGLENVTQNYLWGISGSASSSAPSTATSGWPTKRRSRTLQARPISWRTPTRARPSKCGYLSPTMGAIGRRSPARLRRL